MHLCVTTQCLHASNSHTVHVAPVTVLDCQKVRYNFNHCLRRTSYKRIRLERILKVASVLRVCALRICVRLKAQSTALPKSRVEYRATDDTLAECQGYLSHSSPIIIEAETLTGNMVRFSSI